MEVGPSCLMVSSSKHLRQIDTKHFRTCSSSLVYIRGAENLCMVSIAVSWKTTCGHERDLQMAEVIESFCCNWETGCCSSRLSSSLDSVLYERHILHRDVNPTCRLCSIGLETVDHIVADCSALTLMDYTDRHNQVASITHWNICRRCGFQWRADGTGITLISLWRRTTLLWCGIQPSLLLERSVPIVLTSVSEIGTDHENTSQSRFSTCQKKQYSFKNPELSRVYRSNHIDQRNHRTASRWQDHDRKSSHRWTIKTTRTFALQVSDRVCLGWKRRTNVYHWAHNQADRWYTSGF